jgi:hypothetical protein
MYESGSRIQLGSGSNEPNSSLCGSPRSYVCGEINPSPAPRELDSYVDGPPYTLTTRDYTLQITDKQRLESSVYYSFHYPFPDNGF